MNYGLMNDDEFLNDLAVKICAAALLLCLSLSPLSALGRQELGPGQGAGETVRVETEDEETVPVLVSGPEAGKGLPFLSANAIEHYRGLYETASGRIFVYYTEKEIVALSSWEEASCEGRALRRFRADALAFPSVQPAEERAELLSEGVLVAFYRREPAPDRLQPRPEIRPGLDRVQLHQRIRLRIQPGVALREVEEAHLAHHHPPVVTPYTQILTVSGSIATFFEVPITADRPPVRYRPT